MSKELLHRRSFHCDGDLKSMEKILELERALPRMNGNFNVEKSRNPFYKGGLEAPRNSLDVPEGGSNGLRRHSNVQREDIPMGYVLSRSLTARRWNADSLARKSMSSAESILSKHRSLSKGNAELNQEVPRTQNVVARLMGLEPMPPATNADSLQCSSELFLNNLGAHECVVLPQEPYFTKDRTSISRVSSKRGPFSTEEELRNLKPAMKISNKLSLIRDHPQEKQLQEFKEEFEGKLFTSLKNTERDQDNSLQKVKHDSRRETLAEYQEILDALDFLRQNRETFIKVLRNRSSLFGKHQQHARGGASKEGLGHSKGSKPTQKVHEVLLTQDSRIASSRPKKKIHVPSRLTSATTDPSQLQVLNHIEPRKHEHFNACTSHFLQDERMPRCQHGQSSPLKSGNSQRMITKVLVAGKNDLDVAFSISKQENEVMNKRHTNHTSHLPKPAADETKSSKERGVCTQRSNTCWDSSNRNSTGASMASDNSRANASLLHSRQFSSKSRRTVGSETFGDEQQHRAHVVEKKSSRLPSSADSFSNARKENLVIGRVSTAMIDGKRDSVGGFKHQFSTKWADNKGSFDDARKPTKVLQRSLSASSVETPAKEQNLLIHVHRLSNAHSKNLRLPESSLFKERLLSLKDSFSLNKKKINIRNAPNSRPYEFEEQNESIYACGFRESGSTTPLIQAPASSQVQNDNPAMERCFNNGLPVDRKACDKSRQWPSVGDLLDSTSDVSSEKCEQPSPVSVLVTQFDEESPSPKKQISELHEASSMPFPLKVECKQQLPSSNATLLSSSTMSLHDSAKEANPFETLSMNDIACRNGAKNELSYIRDLLALAGFADNKYIKADYFSRAHFIKPSMFDKMEGQYASMKDTIGHPQLDFASRKCLYDFVDEILSWRLPMTTSHLGPIFKHENLGMHAAYTGKQLLEQIRALVCDHDIVQCSISPLISLDGLASKHLVKDPSWMYLSKEMQTIALELEKSICGDLIREITKELKSLSN